MVCPSWQAAQCLSHKPIRSVFRQPEAKNNEQIKIIIIPIAEVLFLSDIIKPPSY